MRQNYSIKMGDTFFYYHGTCLDEADSINVNHLTPQELERIKQVYLPVDATGKMCSYCHQEIEDASTQKSEL